MTLYDFNAKYAKRKNENLGVPKFFLLRYRRTYVLNNDKYE